MPKPAAFAEWDTNNTNTSATTSGHKSDGWANNEIPTAGEFNYWQKLVASWTKWLDDGMDDTNVTTYALADGNNNNVDISGVSSLVGKTYFHVTYNIATAGPCVLTGITGGYNGKEIVITAVDGTHPYYIEYESASSTANNRIYGMEHNGTAIAKRIVVPPSGSLRLRWSTVTLPGGGTGRWYIISASNCFTEEVLHIPLAGNFSNPGGGAIGDGVSTHPDVFNRLIRQGVLLWANTGNNLYTSLQLDVGSIILSYELRVNKTSGTGTTIDTNLASWDSTDGTLTDYTATTLATSNPGYTGIVHVPTDELGVLVEDNLFYHVRIRVHDGSLGTPTGGGTNDFAYGLKLKVLRPLL